MCRIIFLTSGPINYRFEDASLYKSIAETSLGSRYPSLKVDTGSMIKKMIGKIKEKGLVLSGTRIVSASSIQAIETAKLIGKELFLPVKIDRRLEAINFDFSRIMFEEEFSRLGSEAFDIARPRFLKMFFQNQALEDKEAVKKRIISFLGDVLLEKDNVIAVSHSFLLAIIKAYLEKGEEIFSNIILLEKCFCPQERPFGFLEGFTVNFSGSKDEVKIDMLKFNY